MNPNNNIFKILPFVYIADSTYFYNNQNVNDPPFDVVMILNNSVKVNEPTKIKVINMQKINSDTANMYIKNIIENKQKLLICDLTLDNPLLIIANFLSVNVIYSFSNTIYWLYYKINIPELFTESLLENSFDYFNKTLK